jgi:hypothetical protein
MKKHFLFLFFIFTIILSAYFLNSNFIQYKMKMENNSPNEVAYNEKAVGENFGVGIYNSPNLTDGMQFSQFLNHGSNFSGWLRQIVLKPNFYLNHKSQTQPITGSYIQKNNYFIASP